MKVFISYSHNDEKLANSIRQKLLVREIEVIEIDKKIAVGDDLTSTIYKSIKEADAYIIVLTKSYEDSKWTDLEQILIFDEKFKTKKNKRIIPILFEKNVKIPSLLKNLAYADLTNKDSREESLDEILNQLSRFQETKNDINYQKMKGFIKEQEELLKIKELEYRLTQNKQERLRNSFKWSFMLVTIISMIISLMFLTGQLEKKSFDSSFLNLQSVIFYLLGFLTAIIPAIMIIVKSKRKVNGK